VSYLVGLQGVKNVTFNIEDRVFYLTSDSFNKSRLQKVMVEISKQENREFRIEKYSKIKSCK
jgi:hypothetical protein